MKPPKIYPADLTNSQYKLISGFLSKAGCGPGKKGRPPSDPGTVTNGILYVNKTDCQRRTLPPDFGHWNTVCGYFSRWAENQWFGNFF